MAPGRPVTLARPTRIARPAAVVVTGDGKTFAQRAGEFAQGGGEHAHGVREAGDGVRVNGAQGVDPAAYRAPGARGRVFTTRVGTGRLVRFSGSGARVVRIGRRLPAGGIGLNRGRGTLRRLLPGRARASLPRRRA